MDRYIVFFPNNIIVWNLTENTMTQKTNKVLLLLFIILYFIFYIIVFNLPNVKCRLIQKRIGNYCFFFFFFEKRKLLFLIYSMCLDYWKMYWWCRHQWKYMSALYLTHQLKIMKKREFTSNDHGMGPNKATFKLITKS